MKSCLKAWLGALALGVFMFGLSPSASAADATGQWKWSYERNGETVPNTMTLKQDGEKLTGTVIGRSNIETAIADGRIKDGAISFTVTRERNGAKFVSYYKGRLAGDTIKGTIEMDRGGQKSSREWDARRVQAQEDSHRKAAEQGSAYDQTVLAAHYEYGNGVVKDSAEALKWYHKAAEQNYQVAQVLLGFCYQNGEGTATNDIQALKWFRRAAEVGHPAGQYMLGYCYQYGKGTATNYVEAEKWFNLAAEQDYDIAKKTQSEVAQRLTKKEIEEAQRLAREFKGRKTP